MEGFVTTDLFAVSSASDLADCSPTDPDVEFRREAKWLPCSRCGRYAKRVSLPDSSYTLESVGRQNAEWPDILRWCGSDVWAVNERVASGMESFGLNGYRLKELQVPETIPRTRRPPGHYWIVEPLGKAFCVQTAREVAEIESCDECGGVILLGNENQDCFRLVDGSWDGSDWVSANVDNRVQLALCSARVIDCARRFGWRNAYFGVPVLTVYSDVSVDYHAENWRDLFAFDFERKTREIMRLRGTPETKPPEHPVRPVPVYPPGFVPPVPRHPFDDLGDFDGAYGWHGVANCPSLFGWGELFVELDTPHPERVADGQRPPKRLREVFDAFVAGEKAFLPDLATVFRSVLPSCGVPVPRDVGKDFSDFKTLLPDAAPALHVEDPGKSPSGCVVLSWSLGKDPPRRSLSIRVGVDRKTKRLSILSHAVE